MLFEQNIASNVTRKLKKTRYLWFSQKVLRKKKERRTKQSLDSPQTIEANNNYISGLL